MRFLLVFRCDFLAALNGPPRTHSLTDYSYLKAEQNKKKDSSFVLAELSQFMRDSKDIKRWWLELNDCFINKRDCVDDGDNEYTKISGDG